MKLFKYRSLSKYSIEGLINNEVYFSSFEEFNDPFEFSNPITDLSVYNKRARAEVRRLYEQGKFTAEDCSFLIDAVKEPDEKTEKKRKKLLEKIESGLPDFGVFCLSEINNNILMWSHYAEDHKGFCVEFEALDKSFKEDLLELKVNYISEYEDLNNPQYLIDFYIEMFSNSKGLNKNKWQIKYKQLSKKVTTNEDNELGKSILRNKFSDWEYEKEVRLVNNRVGIHKYNPRSINKIIFGLRMSEKDKSTIKKICESDDKVHIKFSQAVKKEGLFGIQIVDLDNS